MTTVTIVLLVAGYLMVVALGLALATVARRADEEADRVAAMPELERSARFARAVQDDLGLVLADVDTGFVGRLDYAPPELAHVERRGPPYAA